MALRLQRHSWQFDRAQTSFIMFIVFPLSLSTYCQTFQDVAINQGISAMPTTVNFGSGVSFYDFNEDGKDDLSFVMSDDDCRIFLNTDTGFTALPAEIPVQGEGKCLLWVDYDNDGHLDLIVTANNGRHALYRNNGDFTFYDASVEAGLVLENERFYGASFGDYDYDGFLDLYVCVYALDEGADPYFSTNRLYHNNGDGTFSDVTVEAGVADGVKLSFQSIWFDYDMDGLIDLFVINDRLHANSLYKNNGDGTFTNFAEAAGIAFPGQDPMTASLADFDNDGDLDIYLTNTGLPLKQPKLFVNNGDGTFSNLASAYGLQLPHWSWGGVWADFDNDGWQDLYVATGNTGGNNNETINWAYKNSGFGQAFTNVSDSFLGSSPKRSHGVARGDFNNDGYYDIAVVHRFPFEASLWQNSGTSQNYIKVTLRGTASNRQAIGSYIRLYHSGSVFTQFTLCGENYLSQNSQHHIFGLGSQTQIDSLCVQYPSGQIDCYDQLGINMHHVLTEGETTPISIEAPQGLQSCAGSAITLQIDQDYPVWWSTGDTTQSIQVYSSGTYSMSAQNAFGVTYQDSVEVTVHALPLPNVQWIPPSCFGWSDAELTLASGEGPMLATAVWSNGMVGLNIDSLPAGNYSANVTSLNGCEAELEVTINDPPELDMALFAENATPESGGNLLILTSGGTPPLFLYLNGESLTSQSITDLEPGIYHILLLDQMGCALSDSVVIEAPLGSYQGLHGVQRIYPNPTSGTFFLEGLTSQNFVELYLHTMDGRLLWKGQHRAGAIRLPESLHSGAYTLTALHGDLRMAWKIMVVR